MDVMIIKMIRLREHFREHFDSALEPGYSNTTDGEAVAGAGAAAEAINLYGACVEGNRLSAVKLGGSPRFLINHTKRLYVDKATLAPPAGAYYLHPLPILTYDGGGDLSPAEYPFIGTWARDLISVDASLPTGEDFTELPVEHALRVEL